MFALVRNKNMSEEVNLDEPTVASDSSRKTNGESNEKRDEKIEYFYKRYQRQ